MGLVDTETTEPIGTLFYNYLLKFGECLCFVFQNLEVAHEN